MKRPLWLTHWWSGVLGLAFPPACVHCGDAIDDPVDGVMLCLDCRLDIAPPSECDCHRCGAPVDPRLAFPDGCPLCRTAQFRFLSTVAIGVYRDELRQAMLRMKSPGSEALTHSIGILLSERIQLRYADEATREMPFDLIVCAPRHWTRRVLFGSHCVELLAEVIGTKLKIPVDLTALRCRRRVAKQSHLSPQQRKLNVRQAYTCRRVAGRVLFIDDTFTTGATANEATRALLQAGADEVHVAVASRGIG